METRGRVYGLPRPPYRLLRRLSFGRHAPEAESSGLGAWGLLFFWLKMAIIDPMLQTMYFHFIAIGCHGFRGQCCFDYDRLRYRLV